MALHFFHCRLPIADSAISSSAAKLSLVGNCRVAIGNVILLQCTREFPVFFFRCS
jgi:hypothetical protein